MQKNIIVVDLSVKKTSPAGSCVLSELVELSKYYKVHLIANEADESVREFATLYQLSVPKRPLFLRYLIFSLRVKSQIDKLKKELGTVQIVQTTQGQFSGSTISYPHFCHKAYLHTYWRSSPSRGLQRLLRKMNHLYQARMERITFGNAKVIVVPSQGLQKELVSFYPEFKAKIKVVPNPVEVPYFNSTHNFDRAKFRKNMAIGADEIVVAFVALGDFARKGLFELFQSLKEEPVKRMPIKILIVGGNQKEVRIYKRISDKMNLGNKTCFVGFQEDIRPFLWASDLFAMPSLYEVFPLACIQAAAAGLPLLVSNLHGVEEFLIDEQNGWWVDRDGASIASIMKKIVGKEYDLVQMGESARCSVERYDHPSFRSKWLEIYQSIDQFPVLKAV